MKPGWTTVGVLEVVADSTNRSIKLPQSEYLRQGTIPVVDQGSNDIVGFTNDERYIYPGNTPVVIFGDHTRRVKFVNHPFAVGADGVKVLTPRTGVDARYAYHAIRRLAIPSAGYSRHFKFLKEMSVPLPPLDEQRRIAAVLDHLVPVQTRRRRTIDLLARLRESIFFSMFGDPLDPNNPLPRCALGNAGRVITGNSPSRAEQANFGDFIEWIKTDNIQHGSPKLSPAEEYLSEIGAARARVVPAGAVLVGCIAGSASSIGKSAITDRSVAFNQQINGIVPSAQWSSHFIQAQLSVAPDLVRAKSTGGMKGLVNKSAFESIEILAPTQCAQKAFEERVVRIDGLREAAERHLAELDSLFASLQTRAFAGELDVSRVVLPS